MDSLMLVFTTITPEVLFILSFCEIIMIFLLILWIVKLEKDSRTFMDMINDLTKWKRSME